MPTSLDPSDLVARLDRIQRLAEQLAKVRDAIEQQDLAARIQREIQAAKNALQPPTD